jgi:NADP-dependent aldehyde dehydrogenase
MQLTGKNLIAGVEADDGRTRYAALDPSGELALAPEFIAASRDEVDRALQEAEGALGPYTAASPRQRADLLRGMAEEILALGEQLVERCCAETGLPAARIEGERGRTVGQLRMFADLVDEGSWVDARIDTALPDRQPLAKPDLRRMLRPLGPIVVFGASNFPLAFSAAGGDTASALAAGCPVVVKAHRSHPGTAELVGRALNRAIKSQNLPSGLFSLVHGSGADVGTALVTHPLTRAVGFTGSAGGGRALFDAAAARPEPIPVFAEMGSINPVFVLPGALHERGEQIAAGLHQSVTLGVGQFCTNPGLVVGLASSQLDAMAEHAAGLIAATLPATMLNAGIRDSYRRGADAVSAHTSVTVVAESSAPASTARTEAGAILFATDAGTFIRDPELGEEIFGPATLLVRGDSRQQLLEVANGLAGHLTATIHASDAELADYADLIAVLERKVGRLIINGFPTGVEVCSAMTHGGPYPASTDTRFTSVGTGAILRFARPVSYQGFPDPALPAALHDANPLGILRLVDGEYTRSATAARG